MPQEDPLRLQHTYRLFGLLGVGFVGALAARSLFVPDTFGEAGHYRLAAVAEAHERAPRHVGEERCVECHEEVAELHDKDVHATVPCETCHGPGATHAEENTAETIRVPAGKAACLVCHERLAARPADFPQIAWKEHYAFVGVEDESIDCTRCHSPHEPLFLDRDLRSARLHPIVHLCGDCHLNGVDEKSTPPPDHPATFQCDYCHAAVAEDFAARPHSHVRCTTCHLLVRESEYAGRIVRDADPRFCLLCHGEGDFRGEGSAPSIAWPDHREEVAAGPEDADKRCIDCHRDRIHDVTEGAQP